MHLSQRRSVKKPVLVKNRIESGPVAIDLGFKITYPMLNNIILLLSFIMATESSAGWAMADRRERKV